MPLVEFECPKCKGHTYESWGLSSNSFSNRLMYYHMMVNPGLAFNELVLGQRQPIDLFVCKSCPLALVERTYVHCPGCGEFHNGMLWSKQNAFWHWLGLVCPTCGSQIPCLWNIWSRLILVITAPIWWIPVKRYRIRFLAHEQKRIGCANNVLLPSATVLTPPINYVRSGLVWGAMMFILFTVVFPPVILLFKGMLTWNMWLQTTITTASSGIVMWPLGGLILGLGMKATLNKQGDETQHLTFNPDGSLIPHIIETKSEGQDRSER